ncbi:MAG: adenylate kinase [Clostridia bacterium]|nr:adenylate kinase [Clostridia bacterium]MBQ7317142.1 adenylate kinase [Clostridia bacterium]
MKLILLGAPGAGKGTQAANITAKYNIPVVATGDILRAAKSEGTELGLLAKSYMDAGKLVPDEVIIGLIKEKLSSDSCKNGYILDGFPRTIPQAEALDAMGAEVDAVLSLEVADEKIIERMSGRRVCKCGASYHVVYLPSKVDGVCDKCGDALYIRDDDAEATVRKRLETFHAQTEPLKDYYGAKGLLVTVEGREEVEDTTAAVLAALDGVKCKD